MADAHKAKKLTVRNRFAVMAARPGGVSREKAIAAAEKFVASMEPAYAGWVATDRATR